LTEKLGGRSYLRICGYESARHNKITQKIKNTEDTIQKNFPVCSFEKAIGLTKSQPE
jgi:hypothetical protein